MLQPFYQEDGLSLYQGECLDVLATLPEASVDSVCTDPLHGVPGPECWQAIARVCKPGAMMFAFGGAKVYHRLTCAIEDAGWEIRDCLMWLYGQGMPKCSGIGKMIGESKGAEREVVGSKLKPAWEPIVLAMKPLDGTIARNALTWGVAGLNIESCRIAADDHPGVHKSMSNGLHEGYRRPWRNDGPPQYKQTPTGRWPANLLLDDETAALLDRQTGTLTSGTNCVRTKPGDGYHGGLGQAGDVQISYGDSGGASRFFCCITASPSERNPKGTTNDQPPIKPLALMEYLLTLLSTPTGGVVLDPFAGSGTTLLVAKRLGRPCIGVESDAHNCGIAQARISQV